MDLPNSVYENAHILIVDDDERGSLLLKRMLESEGHFEIHIANDPRAAVATFQQLRPDIMLLDLVMPHLDGFELMEQLRLVIPEEDFFPILVLTGDVSPETRLRALKVGAKDFLSKPLDAAEMVARIRNLLATRFLHQELQSYNLFLEKRVRERTGQLEETLGSLRTTQAQVVKRERLGALGVMASGIAHDFNNSLAAILGYGELLLEHPERTDYVKKLMTAGQDARHTVRRLREFYQSDTDAEPFAAVNLNILAEQAVSLTMPRWSSQALASGTRILVKTDLGVIPLIAGNPAELRELLVNLIFNSVDALPNGGEICIQTRAEGEVALLCVTDNGCGMDDATAEKCMEPFFTTKGENGTGLGLSVVHGIVTRHGGRVDILSGLGTGTTFSLRFPATSAVLSLEKPPLTPDLERSLRILLVEDQPIICELIAELLRTDGHAVDTAGSGGGALEKYRQNEYDLVITDLAMPGMSGEQLANVIKQLTPAKPVILLTGFETMVGKGSACTPSIDMVVAKPASLEELRRAIFTVLTSGRAEPCEVLEPVA
ncbi:MAG: response regulator [Chthoniobacter sp.]|uniref:hybrid sensor histidine kinase/response regulator n=1 Tax=Chthoniobacter sp. TaxID=2510640 RepID=UPI0032A728F5